MGTFVNPGNEVFTAIINSERYVDKTGLLRYLNDCIKKNVRYIASSRPRRFGKSMAVDMLAAYYSKACDSADLFRNLEISRDASFKEYLNQYDVICFDVQWMRTNALQAIKRGIDTDVVTYIHQSVVTELKEAYPDIISEQTILVAEALNEINKATKKQFVVIIDEWDCIFREEKNNHSLQDDYIEFLRGLFKGGPSDKFVKLAYITGILPIKKYGTQSALNNFRELTMLEPGDTTKYIGFTEAEVMELCKQCDMPFRKMQKWYDGYVFNTEVLCSDDEYDDEEETDYITEHIYSPNSVMEAISNRRFRNYWSQTENYESLKFYISMDFDGLKTKVVDMLGGGRCRVVTQSFQNDMTSFQSASDVLTLLVHLGYLAYDSVAKEVFIPNEEVRDVFVLSVMDEDWGEVHQAIQDSEKLLKATLSMDETAVAEMIHKVHMEHTSSLVYNNEISLASVIQVAYYSAMKDYTLVRELPSGEGFADMAFIPKRKSGKPALVVELKWDKSAEGALEQIHEKKYVESLKEYEGNLLLVGINYDKKTKKHFCRIEKG